MQATGMLQSMGSQRVGHDLVTEQQISVTGAFPITAYGVLFLLPPFTDGETEASRV